MKRPKIINDFFMTLVSNKMMWHFPKLLDRFVSIAINPFDSSVECETNGLKVSLEIHQRKKRDLNAYLEIIPNLRGIIITMYTLSKTTCDMKVETNKEVYFLYCGLTPIFCIVNTDNMCHIVIAHPKFLLIRCGFGFILFVSHWAALYRFTLWSNVKTFGKSDLVNFYF